MITRTVLLDNGDTQDFLFPESEEDQKVLRKLERAKRLDSRHSFADDPKAFTE